MALAAGPPEHVGHPPASPFTEVFAFLQNQFGAVFGLLLNVALLLILRTMIHAECRMALLSDDPLDTAAAPA